MLKMASTRSQSTRSTRSSKTNNNNSLHDPSPMEVDEVVNVNGGINHLKEKEKSNNNKEKELPNNAVDKSEKGSGSVTNSGSDKNGENSSCELAATVTPMEIEEAPPPPQESSSESSSSDSSDSSDSEDSSDTDEETAQKNKVQDQEDLQLLEKMFLYTREQAYDERMRAVSTKLEEVRSGRAKEYLGPLEQLQDTMSVKVEIASKRREFRLSNLEHKTEAEMLAAQQNFENEKQILYDILKSDLEEKIRRLEEDRYSDFSSDIWFESTTKKKSKKSVDVVGEKKKKPCNVNGPYIVYMLSDVDIMEDWTAVKKILATSKRKCDPAF